ncbi:MAG: tetratricopeptide repeat protein [Flavobacteriaceae bacterium]|nr:tetratricopeptide repeat protein [Flavobacteriaceae bacterium]
MRKQLIFLTALLIGLTTMAQKEEIKTAEKEIKNQNFPVAAAALEQAESLIANVDDKTKAKFYYLKGQAYFGNGTVTENYSKSGIALNEVIKLEARTKSFKYTDDANTMLNKMIEKVAKDASAAYEGQEFSKAARDFNLVYVLSPRDTSYLENAALALYFAKDHHKSIELYQDLLKMGYTGIFTVHKGISKTNGQDIYFATKKEMDQQVKLGIVENPQTIVQESRKATISKNIVMNYLAMDDHKGALEAVRKARAQYPDDYNLLIDEANIYYSLGDNAKFKEKLEEAVKINPTDPSLFYNIGVLTLEQKKSEEAIIYFQKAIDLKPDYADAYNNIGAAILEKNIAIVDEMNKNLSNFKKYDELRAKQLKIYREALPHYEKAHELNKSNISTMQTLMGIYENLEMGDKYKALKDLYDRIKN